MTQIPGEICQDCHHRQIIKLHQCGWQAWPRHCRAGSAQLHGAGVSSERLAQGHAGSESSLQEVEEAEVAGPWLTQVPANGDRSSWEMPYVCLLKSHPPVPERAESLECHWLREHLPISTTQENAKHADLLKLLDVKEIWDGFSEFDNTTKISSWRQVAKLKLTFINFQH